MTLDDKGRVSRGGGPGSQSALRSANTALVTTQLASRGPATQAMLARATGLSPGTVANIVHDLVAQGRARLEPTTSSGRRALAVHLVEGRQVVIGIDLGRSHARVMLVTLAHRVIADVLRPLPVPHTAAFALDQAREMIAEAYEQTGRSSEDVLGAGVALPGPYSARLDSIGQTTIVPEWVGEGIAARISEALDVPVLVDNDANLGALAQLTWSEDPPEDFLFVKIATGIGTGIVSKGELFRGAHGVAGELGHTNVVENGETCRCGNRGCLETVASIAALLRALAGGANPPQTAADIVDACLAGDVAALRVVDDAGLALGRVIGQAASLMDPAAIVLSGPLAGVGDILLGPIRRGLARHTVPEVVSHVDIRWSDLTGRAEALGAAALALLTLSDAAPVGHVLISTLDDRQ